MIDESEYEQTWYNPKIIKILQDIYDGTLTQQEFAYFGDAPKPNK